MALENIILLTFYQVTVLLSNEYVAADTDSKCPTETTEMQIFLTCFPNNILFYFSIHFSLKIPWGCS